MGQSISINQFVHWGVTTCQVSDSIQTVTGIMYQQNIGSIFVTDGTQVVGAWTQSDIKYLSIDNPSVLAQPISEVMSAPVISIRQHDSVANATFLFKKHNIHHLLVVDEQSQPVGVLSDSDIILLQVTEAYLSGINITSILPPDFFQVDQLTSVNDSLKLMCKNKTDALLVTQKNSNQVGIVTNRDLLAYIGKSRVNSSQNIGQVAKWPLITISESTSLLTTRELMVQNHFHHIGIVNAEKEIIGIINFSHLVHAIESFFYRDISQEIIEKTDALKESNSLYQSIVEKTSSFILIHQRGKPVYVNPSALEAFEYTLEEAKQLSAMDFVAPEYQNLVKERVLNQSQSQPTIEELFVTKSGRRFWGEACSRFIQYDGKPATLVIAHDIDDKKRQSEQPKIIQTVFEKMDEALIVTDENNKIIMVNKAFEDIYGYTEQELVGKTSNVLKSDHETTETYSNLWQSLHQTGAWQGELWNRKKNGEIFPQWVSISAIKNNQNELTNFIAIYRDLTDKKQIEAEINRLSFYDLLTGLPNYNLFKDRLKHAIKGAEQNKGFRCAVIYLDLARFKRVNDAVGHTQGDQLLIQVAQRLESIVSSENTVARMGADNFLIMLENIHSQKDVVDFASNMIEQFSEPFILDEHSHTWDIKMGISLFPTDGSDAISLITAADEAVYKAKELPNSGFEFHTKQLAESAFEHFFLEKGLRKALSNDEFVVYFQPQILMSSQKIIGAESLVRWQHPDLGLVPPDKFINIAEETGLIIALGEVILQKSCAQWCQWQAEGLVLNRLSVNVSAIQLTDANFVKKVRDILNQTKMPAQHLEIEVTESFLFKNEQQGICTLNGLKALGCKISMDDFGTGFSSLSYLKKLPINQLKIDQSFVRNLPNDLEDMAIIDSIIAVSHALNLEVVAEGVETMEQSKLLQSKGCDLAQGYGYARPMEADKMFIWAQQHDAK